MSTKKFKNRLLKFSSYLFALSLLTFPWMVFAKEIKLYEQPKMDAKVVATVDLSAGIIPIYTPKADSKEKGWIKIADPRNGNVGWVQSSDLNNTGSSSSVTITQSIVNDNKSPMTYRVIQMGQPTDVTSEQSKAMEKQIEQERQAVQQSMQNMMRDINQLYKDSGANFQSPFLMPVIVLPVQKNTTTSPKAGSQNINQPPGDTRQK